MEHAGRWGGVAGQEKINTKLGRKKAVEIDVHFASNLVLAGMVSSRHILREVQVMLTQLLSLSFHSFIHVCALPRPTCCWRTIPRL